MTATLALLAASCVSVEGGRITAGDLARADAVFAAVPPDTTLGHAPAPGIRRFFRAGELAALAARFGVTRTSTAPVCFEVATALLKPEQLLAPLRESLGRQDLEIELVDYYRGPVPAGRIEFPGPVPSAAHPEAGVVWRGSIHCEPRRFAIWAQVRIHGSVTRVTASADLKAGVPIAADWVKEETRDIVLAPGKTARSVDEVVNRIPRRNIAAGSPIPLDALDAPFDVRHGETVSVESRCGGARLVMDALAQTDGRRGQLITARNPSSGKLFKALVDDKGKASVNGGGCR